MNLTVTAHHRNHDLLRQYQFNDLQFTLRTPRFQREMNEIKRMCEEWAARPPITVGWGVTMNKMRVLTSGLLPKEEREKLMPTVLKQIQVSRVWKIRLGWWTMSDYLPLLRPSTVPEWEKFYAEHPDLVFKPPVRCINTGIPVPWGPTNAPVPCIPLSENQHTALFAIDLETPPSLVIGEIRKLLRALRATSGGKSNMHGAPRKRHTGPGKVRDQLKAYDLDTQGYKVDEIAEIMGKKKTSTVEAAILVVKRRIGAPIEDRSGRRHWAKCPICATERKLSHNCPEAEAYKRQRHDAMSRPLFSLSDERSREHTASCTMDGTGLQHTATKRVHERRTRLIDISDPGIEDATHDDLQYPPIP